VQGQAASSAQGMAAAAACNAIFLFLFFFFHFLNTLINAPSVRQQTEKRILLPSRCRRRRSP
jgi:hypothetical protein